MKTEISATSQVSWGGGVEMKETGSKCLHFYSPQPPTFLDVRISKEGLPIIYVPDYKQKLYRVNRNFTLRFQVKASGISRPDYCSKSGNEVILSFFGRKLKTNLVVSYGF